MDHPSIETTRTLNSNHHELIQQQQPEYEKDVWKYAQASLLILVPIIICFTFCQEKGCSVFIACYLGEVCLHYWMNQLEDYCKKKKQPNHHSFLLSKIAIEARMMSDIFIHQFLTQMYYGPWFPSSIFSTFKMLTSACDVVHGGFCAWNGLITIVCSVLCTYLSGIWGEEMSELEIKLFHRRLVEILCLQLTVMVGSYVVSHFLAFKNREFLQQNIKAAQERYKNVEKTKFIANMSHEARNPLHCIMGSLQVMEHHFDGEEYSAKHCCKHCFLSNGAIQESIEDIKENATLLLHILSSSLQMSSLEMGKIQLKHEPFNLKVLLDSLIGVFSQLAHEKNISLHLFYDVSRVPQLFQGDSVRLSQIIMNIISNAIKYTKKGYVRVNCMLAKDDKHEDFTKLRKNRVENSSACQVLLEFIDTGCGISQDQIHKLFQPYGVLEHQNEEFENSSFEQYFHQSENLRKLNDGGSTLIYTHRNGLGLSITKLLIHKMKGHIKVVSSQVGVGTKMTISLPLETCDNSNIEKSIGGFLLSDNSMAYHVTIIDDDECFREVLKDYLSLMKRVKSIACYESVSESMQNQVKSCDDSYSDRKSLSLIIVPEREYEKATNCFGKKESKIISTIFKGEKRNFQNALYLPKPIKFSELVELFNTMMTSEENSDNESVDMEGCVSCGKCELKRNESHDKIRDKKSLLSQEHEFDFSKFSVLLADDNAVNRKVLVKMLQIIGFKDIDTSNDGMQCFEKFKEKSYHLVLLDCFMPILSGKEACEMIRNWVKYRHHQKEELPRIPIIAITANTWEPKETLLSQGFDDVVYKPFVLEDFRSLLRSYLGKVNNIH